MRELPHLFASGSLSAAAVKRPVALDCHLTGFRAGLHGGGGSQVGEVTRLGVVTHLSL